MSRGLGLALVAVAIAAAATACTGSGDKAGGQAVDATVVLTIATREPNDGWVDFAAAVLAESHGTVRLEPRIGWRAGELDFERTTIADVRGGVVDLAEVGVGVWDTVGVQSFRALVAPLLISDLNMERNVLSSPLARAMLEGVRPLGLVGLALLPGELRRPFGVTRQLVGREDYRGALVVSDAGRVARATWEALAARPVSGRSVSSADGTALDLATIDGNGLDTSAHALTGNVVLWPRVRSIVIGRRAFERLTAAQREALRRAGRTAVEPAFRRVEGDEVRALARICRRARLPFVLAGRHELAALRAGVRPVYASLGRDPRTRVWLDAVRRLRGSDPTSAAAVGCTADASAPPPGVASPLDGMWRMRVSREELIRRGTPPVEADGVHGRWAWTIHAGRFEIHNRDRGYVWSGRATVEAHIIVLEIERCPVVFPPGCSPGETYAHRWSLYRDTVTFAPVAGRTYAPIFLVKAWARDR